MSLSAVQESQDIQTAVMTAFRALMSLSSHDEVFEDFDRIPIMQKIVKKMRRQEPLKFLIPAFPAKSPSPLKTSGVLPDLGEVLALVTLNEMCQKISRAYEPGAEVVICSDGRVFSDVVMVSDEVIDTYAEGVQGIVQDLRLKYLSTFAMDDVYRDLRGQELRQRLIWQYAKPIEEIRYLVVNDPDFQSLFNGMHRFMIEDQIHLEANVGLSKNQVSKRTKMLTYELIRRSDAWSTLLLQHFDDPLRLSIHPYPLEHEKFGVRLVPAKERWATPWHNVVVQKDESFELMPYSKALELGAEKHFFRGKYAFFKI